MLTEFWFQLNSNILKYLNMNACNQILCMLKVVATYYTTFLLEATTWLFQPHGFLLKEMVLESLNSRLDYLTII